MADVRDPVGVGLEHGRTTSPQSAAVKDSDLRAAARELQSAGADPTVVHGQRALFVAFVIVLVVSVIWVREFETPTCPTKSVSAGDIRTNDQPNRGLRADTAHRRRVARTTTPPNQPIPRSSPGFTYLSCRNFGLELELGKERRAA